ncbi:MAG: M20/M25/M40 family metallo-hydrolase, partial [Clostridia bacterium]|nr:M20/M25/M40 family metallo-hydrolase [Clostridia bacterium]
MDKNELLEKGSAWIKAHINETLELLDALCRIPAPSGKEEKRAEFCKKWLEKAGAEGVFIDGALNVVFPFCDNGGKLTAVLTHTDTVFPDLTPFDIKKDEKNWRCPGIGDNTVHVAQNMMIVKFLLESGVRSDKGILFVCNSCEEGLGNLKGVREIIKNYGGRIDEFFAIDGQYTSLATKCVGSKRYKITVKTEGGHSYGAFGNKNAIHLLSKLVCGLYEMKIPAKEGTKTTFNVGTISGGTSVNTIAQNAEMLFEYRSDDKECLENMDGQFESILKDAEKDGVDVSCEVVGERPCMGDVDPEKLKAIIDKAANSVKKYYGGDIRLRSSSTDCNIPLSRGIPSVCLGGYIGGGAHTREEYIEIDSVLTGHLI